VSDQQTVAVTVYNDNLGLIREVRGLQLAHGRRELEYADVASGIDPTSVSLRSLTAPSDLGVLEQNYEFDLITPSRLLDKFVGLPIELQQGDSLVQATLLSNQDGTVLKIGDQVYPSAPGNVVLPRLPANLAAHPTLKWLLENDHAAGPQKTEVSYLTSGLSWHANYVLVSSADGRRCDVNGWVTLDNQSGATYRRATLTLVAGDVNRVRDREEDEEREKVHYAKKAALAAPQFAERALFEYHSYLLNRPTTLLDRQTKQLSLLSAARVPSETVYRFEDEELSVWSDDTERHQGKVTVYLTLKNSHANHLGIPLPKGTVRVYQADADRHLQFIGEDAIDHTPRDEWLRLKLGQAFDLVAERRQTAFRDFGPLYETSYEVTLRNHKDAPVRIVCAEPLSGEWTITRSSHPFRKIDATNVEFTVPVAANSESKLTFTVHDRE
jgi:hypothetical protein